MNTNPEGPDRFAIVPEWLVYNRRVDDRALRLWLVLARHENSKTGRCDPSRERLARLLGCSEASVDRAVAQLVAAGAVEKIPGHGAKRATNSYRLRRVPLQVVTGDEVARSQVVTGDESKSSRVTTKRKHLNEKKNAAVVHAHAREADDHGGGDPLSSGEGEPDGFAEACGSCAPINRRQRDEWVAAYRGTPEAFSDTRAALEAEEAAGKIGSAEKVLATRVRDGKLRRNGNGRESFEVAQLRVYNRSTPTEIAEGFVRTVAWEYTDESLADELRGQGLPPEEVDRLLAVAAEVRAHHEEVAA